MRCLAWAVVFLSLSNSIVAQSFTETKPPKHLARLFKHAANGNPEAQFQIAMAYLDGKELPQDDGEAARLFHLAADHGYMPAQTNLGYLYASGRGVERDDTEAFRWFLRAATAGSAAACSNVAVMFQMGRGIPRNDKAAFEWFNRAARMKNYTAYVGLAELYLAGRGTQRNEAKGMGLISEAAKHGVAIAQAILANAPSRDQSGEQTSLALSALGNPLGVSNASSLAHPKQH
jgi:uncharacterized protein